MHLRLVLLGLFVASAAAAQTPGDSECSAAEAVLRDQRLPNKGPELLQVLRDRTPSANTVVQFKKHVARLNAAAYADRLKATADLTKMGPVVRPLLENLLLDIKADAETIGRLRQVLEKFPADKDCAAASAAARLIARDKPSEALRVLLDFVPYTTHEALRQDVQRSINAVAFVDKKPAPLLIDALKDADPARRAAAGEALVRVVGIAGNDQVKPLLTDAHPLVRYQLGLALVERYDKRGIPLLIESIADSPTDRVECALDLLYRAAGDDAPTVYYQGKHTAAACGAAWQKWHAKHKDTLDLAKQLARPELGYTVITTTAIKPNTTSKILEIGPGPEHAIRWEFAGPRYPLDLQILGPNRMLMAEYFDRRVTERDFKGNILKQFSANMPIGCQRFPNGDTFIVTRQQLLLVDRDGKDVFTHTNQGAAGLICAAQRLRNGQMAVATSGGRCHLLDPQGRELKSFAMGGSPYALGGSLEILPNGRILVALYNVQTVAEFDWAGNKLWQATVNRPVSATRLANGNTLVTCSLDYRVVEIDPQGKEVWSYQTEGRPFRARRR